MLQLLLFPNVQNTVAFNIVKEWLLVSDSDNTSISSESDSGEDWEPPKKISKVENFVEFTMPEYSNMCFKEHFKMARTTVYKLIGELERSPFQPRCSHTYISAEHSFLLSICYLANTESFRQVADRFNVSLSSAHRILVRVLQFILTVRKRYITWPNGQEKVASSTEFQKKAGFQGVLGCIDGSHFRVRRPKKDEEVYVNRKGFHSVLLQGIVNHRKMFIYVYCGEPGSLHDARLLQKSSVYTKAQNPDFFGDYYLLGDSAYPSLPWLVPPFRDNGNLSPNHKEFNFRLSSTRIVVEHAFGLLGGRFRRLGHFENLNIKLIVQCIMCACVLHNICITENDLLEEYNMNLAREDDVPQQNVNLPVQQLFDKRQQLFQNMFNI